MKSDAEIQKNVKEELKWDSRINGLEVDVNVQNGHVTLSGTVNTYPKKIHSEIAAMRVAGVTGVSNNIRVNISEKRRDTDIARSVMNAITWNSSIDENKLKVKVE